MPDEKYMNFKSMHYMNLMLFMLMASVACGFSPWHNTIVMHENTGKGSRLVAPSLSLFLLQKDPHMNICGLAALEFAYIPNYKKNRVPSIDKVVSGLLAFISADSEGITTKSIIF